MPDECDQCGVDDILTDVLIYGGPDGNYTEQWVLRLHPRVLRPTGGTVTDKHEDCTGDCNVCAGKGRE